jgi:hypothetical protein
MKQKPTFKTLLVVASFVSLSAFVFVNVQSNFTLQKDVISSEFVQPQMEDGDDQAGIAVPDVTVLGRLWEIAQKLIDRKH